MPYNRVNKLRRYRLIVQLTNEHAEELALTSFRYVWERYIVIP